MYLNTACLYTLSWTFLFSFGFYLVLFKDYVLLLGESILGRGFFRTPLSKEMHQKQVQAVIACCCEDYSCAVITSLK